MVEYGSVLDTHSFILTTLAETGIFGALSFVGLLTYIVWRLYKGYQRQAENSQWHTVLLMMLIMVIAGIVFQLFSTSYFLARFWFPVGVAMASLTIASQNLKTSRYE
jgi:O-antigen ligase